MATLFGLVAILSWGLLAVLSVYSKGVSPFQLLTICFLIASCLIYIYRIIKRQPLLIKPTLNSIQWLTGIAGIFGFHCLYFIAMRYAPAVEVSLIVYLWPLLLGVYLTPKALLGHTVLGGLLGFSGVFILIYGNTTIGIDNGNILGYLCALSCALIWSGYSWFISRYKSDTGDISWITFVCGLLALIAHLMLEEESRWAFTVTEWLTMLLLGLGPVGGAFYLWEIGMKAGNRRLLASCSFFTPVISTLALYTFGMSGFSLDIMSALFLILLGASITNIKNSPKTTEGKSV